jgi:hypothetical protein
MYDFHYNYIKRKYGKNARLLFIPTRTGYVTRLKPRTSTRISRTIDVHEKFDTSNFDKNHSSGIPVGINKKVIGMMRPVGNKFGNSLD